MKRAILSLSATLVLSVLAAPQAEATGYGYKLHVKKTAETTFKRQWTWTIDKWADTNYLSLVAGYKEAVHYKVTVDAEKEDRCSVAGKIKIYNPDPWNKARIEKIEDKLSDGTVIYVDCGIDYFPYYLPPGETLWCEYEKDLPDCYDRTNKVIVTTSGKVAGNWDSAPVNFPDDPTVEKDECVTVTDSNFYDPLGEVCADYAPKSFDYYLTFGKDAYADVELNCGYNEHKNVAKFTTNDTYAMGTDDWTVKADVACDPGCTLTPGYWKTHSKYGPAPYDNTWAEIGEHTPFFLSEKSYYQVLWTAPKGDPYFILSFHYIAAVLNIKAGALAPQNVLTALAAAKDLFEAYKPGEVTKEMKSTWIGLAETLAKFNEGQIGPGHCDGY